MCEILSIALDPDVHLVARARHGDDFAFGQLVRRHHSSVHRAARAILGSAADAEDVVQEAWLQADVHLSRFQGTASFKTWVHAIVRIARFTIIIDRRADADGAATLKRQARPCSRSCAPRPDPRGTCARR